MMESMTRIDENRCWQALLDRDASQDGVFYYGVLTTGVYCRPSCSSRRPNRENVRFYATPDEAERDGLRPCMRCHPRAASNTDPAAERVRALCRYIEQNAGSTLSLEELAREAKLSPYHLQRSFKAIVGVSPKQYVDDCRLRNFKSILRREGEQVTGAIYEAGFGSSSRLYERVGSNLGMTPMEYRQNGRSVDISYASASTGLGLMLIGATDRGLCFLQFGESEATLLSALRAEYSEARITPMASPAPAEFGAWMEALQRYLAGAEPDLRLPVHVRATAFQMKVWRYLQTIPQGSVESYAEVARAIGEPKAVRAVARACATNEVALAIPCHRVIRGTGELGGYRWGLERKRVLLDNERAARARATC